MYIQILNSLKNGYNIQPGGQESCAPIVSPEKRKHVGELNRRRMLGTKLSEETKAKMRASSPHHSPTPEQRKAVSDYMKNRIVKDETKEKLRQANLGEKSPAAKLTNEEVKHIKMLIECGMFPMEIANIFDISRCSIYGIKSGKVWTHVEYETLFKK